MAALPASLCYIQANLSTHATPKHKPKQDQNYKRVTQDTWHMQARCCLACHLVVFVLERDMVDIVIANDMGAYIEHAEYVSKREGD